MNNKKENTADVDQINIKKVSNQFLNSNLKYNDLSDYEKSIVDSFIKADPAHSDRNIPIPIYYDEEKALFAEVLAEKFYLNLCFYNLKTFERGSCIPRNSDNDNMVSHNGNYLIFSDGKSIYYLKPGMSDYKLIKDSELVSDKETYVIYRGMGIPTYEYFIDVELNTLNISVFNSSKYDERNILVKRAKFVLP